jgi:AcrR family transcriptional regulator
VTTTPATEPAPAGDRRARRRRETIEEILDIAETVMLEEGVNGLSVAEVARRLGVQPPSLYKYFPSLMAVYDALFARGAAEHLSVMRAAVDGTAPGLAALTAALDAGGRWSLEHRALAQLLFWRPVPNFAASPDSMAPSVEMVELQRGMIHDAVLAGELGAEAEVDDAALYVVASLISGVLTGAMANEPDLPWGQGRFSPAFPHLMQLLPAAFPPH